LQIYGGAAVCERVTVGEHDARAWCGPGNFGTTTPRELQNLGGSGNVPDAAGATERGGDLCPQLRARNLEFEPDARDWAHEQVVADGTPLELDAVKRGS
jgi:hypothetical protein